MIRRRVVKRTNASNCPDLPLSKGVMRGDEKNAKVRAEERHRALVRRMVWKRSDGRCELCGAMDMNPSEPHEMHEIRSRAQTRGMSPEQRFNTANCLRLCRKDHHDVTENRIRLVLGDKGANGFVRAVPVTPKTLGT